jgi:hypothetical protein
MKRVASRAKDVTTIESSRPQRVRSAAVGTDGTSVADIMKEAGLTHGGFYAHCASREAMLAEAADRAGAEAAATCRRASWPLAGRSRRCDGWTCLSVEGTR